jgi:clan AA aspartic protease (TIGR02281 family)
MADSPRARRCPACLSHVADGAEVCEACGAAVGAAPAARSHDGLAGLAAGAVLALAVLGLGSWLLLRPPGPAASRPERGADPRPATAPATSAADAGPPAPAPDRHTLARFQAVLRVIDPEGVELLVPALVAGDEPHLIAPYDSLLGATDVEVVHPAGVEVVGFSGVSAEHGFVVMEVRGGATLTSIPIQPVGRVTLPRAVDALPFTAGAAPGRAIASLVTTDAAGRRVLRVSRDARSGETAPPFAAISDGSALALVLQPDQGLLLEHAIPFLRAPARMSWDEFRRRHWETSAAFLFSEGSRALEAGRLAEASEKLASALLRAPSLRDRITPFLARAYHLRIRELLRQGADLEAERLLAEAFAQLPADPDLTTARIAVALKTGDVAAALAALGTLPPEARTGSLEEAVAESARSRAAELFGRRRMQEALDLMAGAVERFPDRADLRLELARMLVVAGRGDEAVQHAHQARLQDPTLASEADAVRASAERARQPDVLEIPFDPGAPSIVTPVGLGSLSLECLIDTGATKSAIPRSIAQRLGLLAPGLPTVDVETAGGTVKAQVVKIPELRIGQFTLQNVEALILDLPGGLSGKGLIGLNVLNGFEMHVDRDAGLLVLRRRRGR